MIKYKTIKEGDNMTELNPKKILEDIVEYRKEIKKYKNNKLNEDELYIELTNHIYEVFKSVKDLANKMYIKTPTEIVTLVDLLIKMGALSKNFKPYEYDLRQEKSLYSYEIGAIAQVIAGKGNCKHTALFLNAY